MKEWIDDVIMMLHPDLSNENQLIIGMQSKIQDCSCAHIFTNKEIQEKGLKFVFEVLKDAKVILEEKWRAGTLDKLPEVN